MPAQILNKISFAEFKRRYLNLKGILDGCHAYKGPDVVQIDLTDQCNSGCLVCWLHSPFLKDEAKQGKAELDMAALSDFIKDIAESGTREIIFSGGGEPFLYSNIWGALELAEKSGLGLRINTNLIALHQGDIQRLLAFRKLLSLTVSIWAGTADLYQRLHSRPAETFFKVKESLKYINGRKPARLTVRIYAVINNLNYGQTYSLLSLAQDTGCREIEFGVPDVIPGVTDHFLLNKEQLGLLKEDINKLDADLRGHGNGVKIVNRALFLKRISNPGSPYGEYDSWAQSISCYAGWVFLRLRANGDLNSCLKSHRRPIGNIYRERFASAWNNGLQREFRKMALRIPKDKDYFSLMGNSPDGDIGCRRCCDNLLVNARVFRFARFLK